MKAGDRVERRKPIYRSSCGCRGCWIGDNRGKVLGVTDGGVVVLFDFGVTETIRDEEELRVLDAVDAIAGLNDARR